ncbi:hypothetical protein [Gimesia aquarii]|uniref:Uncharacterized protein n=1 Tax=Gimesia aquarii TaxID=2527964 RepID=A0A517WS32_9PLAN|nr:hypothetical protein [Gimesia aquarii]QDU08038.1 hypothetical protein V202x_14010 [Gimesia aquarii]
MFCWRIFCFMFSIMILCSGSLSVINAQTEFHEIDGQPQKQTAVIGLLGEFAHCAAYEVADQDLQLNKVISRTGGLTAKSSGIVRIIRGGRISQNLFYSADQEFPLMNGDVLLAMKSSARVIDEVSNQQWNYNQRNQQQGSPELIQVAIINLLNRPIVFGLQPEIADLASILRCLNQPIEKYPQIARTIKVIPPHRGRHKAAFTTNKLTTKLDTGTVLVLNAKQSLDLSLVPKSLPAPIQLHAEEFNVLASPAKMNAPVSLPLETSRFQQVPPVKKDIQETFQGVAHPENIPGATEEPRLELEDKQLQLNGPLLQQTTANLDFDTKPKKTHVENRGQEPKDQSKQQDKELTATPTVPEMHLKAAPAPPAEAIQVLSENDLMKLEEAESKAGSSFWSHWSIYLLLTFVGVISWRFYHKKTKAKRDAVKDGQQQTTMSPESEVTLVANWESLPPLPEKSLLEQILENNLPIIEETPQIPTDNFIYGRHQTRSARIDQRETLKGPHFNKQTDRGSKIPVNAEVPNAVPAKPRSERAEKTLKTPAFRFDRPHPEASKSPDENRDSKKSSRPVTSNHQPSEKANETSGILDRVLQAMQGVIQK